jgi:hypothetical protein
MPLPKDLKKKVLKSIAALAAIWAIDYADLLTRVSDIVLSFF